MKVNCFKLVLGLFAFAASSSIAIADPNMDDQAVKPNNVATVMSADSMQSRHNGQESLLKGNVKIAFGRAVTITGNEVLVMYADANKHEISECIIYGVGLIQNGDHTMRFRNGVFKPRTSQFSAERTNI